MGDLQFKASRFTEKMREHQIEREKEERRSSQNKKVYFKILLTFFKLYTIKSYNMVLFCNTFYHNKCSHVSKKKGIKGSPEKKMVTFKEPDTTLDLSSHNLVNHADQDSDKFHDLALDTLPETELGFEVKVISVS